MTFLINVLTNILVGFSTLWCIGMNDPAKNPGTYQDYVLNQLNPDCYYNWAIYSEDNLKNTKFDPMLWSVYDARIVQAVNLAKKYPGRTWLVYNEPEGLDQANTKPEKAAEWFDKVYTAIKEVDPTATIACCGVMVRTEGMDWLTEFVKKVVHLPDVWHIHIYINTDKISDWKLFYEWFLWWNEKYGSNKSIYVTETCATYLENQDNLLADLFEYSHPLLKRIYWFSAYPEPYVPSWNCNLLRDDGNLSGLGGLFSDRNNFNKLTPVPEPTFTPTFTPTATPTITPTITPTKTPNPTVTPNPDETTGEVIVDEPTIMIFEYYLPIVSK